MNELLILLVAAFSTLAEVPNPKTVPVVEATSAQHIQYMACDNKTSCSDVHFYTDPITNIIYIDKNVDMAMTFARGELLREVGRWVLQGYGVYSPRNRCSKNVAIETNLVALEAQYMKWVFKNSPEWKGVGVPATSDQLPNHLFYCVPDSVKPPDVEV